MTTACTDSSVAISASADFNCMSRPSDRALYCAGRLSVSVQTPSLWTCSSSGVSALTVAEIERLGREEIPFVDILGLVVEQAADGQARVRAPFNRAFLRPGATIAGPVLMGLADFAMYAALLTKIGLKPEAVTTNLNINFLRRPEPKDLIASARIIKLGRRLAVGDIFTHVDGTTGEENCVAHATATYALPPDWGSKPRQ